MSSRFWRYAGVVTAGIVTAAYALAVTELPAIGASALLHPARRPVTIPAPDGCVTRTLAAGDMTLTGWTCDGRVPWRGTLVYLHGVADNRESGIGIIKRFVPRGLTVVAYDSRAHGDSKGEACTYGYFEQADLHRILDTVAAPIVLVGNSLGAAVALQEAAHDSRVAAIVAIAPFADLRTIATERAPFVFTHGIIERAFARAEADAHFHVDVVSPVMAAREVTAAVLLVHGAADVDTPPAHSVRIASALAGPAQLMIVPELRHNDPLPAPVWDDIERWVIEHVSPTRGRPASTRGQPVPTRADPSRLVADPRRLVPTRP